MGQPAAGEGLGLPGYDICRYVQLDVHDRRVPHRAADRHRRRLWHRKGPAE